MDLGLYTFAELTPDPRTGITAEKLDLLLALRDGAAAGAPVTWAGGRHRAPLSDAVVMPPPRQAPLPVWIAVGGNPQSVVRAAALGLPLAVAIIGGEPERFRPLVDLYREAWERAGHDPAAARVSINSHGYLADGAQQARDEWYPAYKVTMDRLGEERGWPPSTRQQFDASTTLRGANLVGSPREVAEKILFQHELFEHDRFLLQLSVGTLPHADVMRAIELYGTEVAPLVRTELARREAPAPA